MRLITTPHKIAPRRIVTRYATAALRPTSAETVVSDIAFIAGPTMRNTNAAPGETPFAMRDAAIGIDAVEQTYIGNPTSAMTGIAIQSLPWNAFAKKLSGTSTVTIAEIASPMASGFATDPRSRLYACQNIALIPRDPAGASSAATISASSPPTADTTTPPTIPVSAAATGRATAKTGPIRA